MNVLFLGLGGVGQRHLRNFISLTNNSHTLSAVSRHNKIPEITNQLIINRDVDIVSKYNLAIYRSVSEINCIPDLVVISTPSALHYEQALYFLNKGSHVYLEKPATLNSLQCKHLISTAHKRLSRVSVSFQLRYNPAFLHLRQLVEQEGIHSIAFVECVVSEYMPNWHRYEDYRNSYASLKRLGGGVVFTQIHELDLLCSLFPSLEHVYSYVGKQSQLEIDVEDISFSLFTSNLPHRSFPVSLRQDYLGYPTQRFIKVQYTDKSFVLDFTGPSLSISEVNKDPIKYDYSDFDRNIGFRSQLSDFLASLKSDPYSPSDVSLEDALVSISLAEKILAR